MIAKMVLKTLLISAGFLPEQITTMMCIAKWESSFNPNAINVNKDGSNDIGLYQINDKYWVNAGKWGCPYTRDELLNPEQNVKCAKIVYDKMGYDAWVAYKDRLECNQIDTGWYEFRTWELYQQGIY